MFEKTNKLCTNSDMEPLKLIDLIRFIERNNNVGRTIDIRIRKEF